MNRITATMPVLASHLGLIALISAVGLTGQRTAAAQENASRVAQG